MNVFKIGKDEYRICRISKLDDRGERVYYNILQRKHVNVFSCVSWQTIEEEVVPLNHALTQEVFGCSSWQSKLIAKYQSVIDSMDDIEAKVAITAVR